MLNLLRWFKPHQTKVPHSKAQKFVEIKRGNITVEFIHAGHPLYDNILDTEKDQVRLLAPNDAAYNETSLLHNFAAITTYNEQKYLVINTLKHFKEQSIGALLQYDENIYQVIPFLEDEEQYQTTGEYLFNEVYEYDHPVESYAFIAEYEGKRSKILFEHGKQPLHITMLDSQRPLFAENLPPAVLEVMDYVVLPTINTYKELQNRHQNAI